MAGPIKQLLPHLLLVPVGGKFEDGQYIFKKQRTSFKECRLMYKPDYFFHRYGDDSNGLARIIQEQFHRFSAFPWDQLFTLEIDQRIELQKRFFQILDEQPIRNVNTPTTIEKHDVTAQTKLVEKINAFRLSANTQPELISYRQKDGDQVRYFVWLVVKVKDYQLPNLDATQRFNELFYLLHHFYSTDRIDSRIRLSIDYNHSTIDTHLTLMTTAQPDENNIPTYEEIIVPTDEKEKQFYSEQIKVGNDLFRKIIDRIPDFENRYDQFEVSFLLPPRISLRKQSLARMRKNFTPTEKEYLHIHDDDDSLIYLIHPANRLKYEINVINKALHPTNRRTMFLIIQDECHWGMNIDSQADRHFVNKDILLDNTQLDNIYFLQVSATPYNIDAIQDFRRDNILRWDDSVTNFLPRNYQGRLELIRDNKIRCQSTQSKNLMFKFGHYYSTLAYLSANDINGRLSLPELSIFCEYFITLHYLLASRQNPEYEYFFPNSLKEFVTEETKEILQGLCQVDANGKGYLAVLRLNSSKTAQKLKESLQQLLRVYNQSDLFDIVVDTDDDQMSLYDRLSNVSREKYQKWWKLDRMSEKDRRDFGYDNLKYFPLLLIVIEKGRMGDTFPSETFRYFDLRARYQGYTLHSTPYCTLLQDVGRSFGYPNANYGRPTVFMGEEIFQLLNQNTLQPHETLKRTNNTDANINLLTTENVFIDLNQHWMPNKDHPFGPGAEPSKRDAHKNVAYRRFLLSAHPQIGKTASFLWTVHLFVQHFTKPKHGNLQGIPNEFYTILYNFREQDSNQLHTNLNKEEIYNDWNQFHLQTERIYQTWREEPNEIVPIEHSIKIIEDAMTKLATDDELIIIDMGCGLAKLAQHFRTKDQIKVLSIDHKRHPLVPDDIDVLEMDMKNLTLNDIGNKLAHFVVFSLSLWGTEENITSYIQTATDLLELDGRMIIIDAKNNQMDHKKLKNVVISMLNKTRKFSHKVSPQRPDSKFFCIVAKREEEEDF